MRPSGPAIRAERPRDRAAIHALHRAAFGAAAEADLVDQLREDGTVVLSLVAEEDGAIVGHVLYSRLTIDGDEDGASALAPVAVLPGRQKSGVGRALIEAAHATLANSGEKLVFVLGDPEYYQRFGFSAETAKAFRTPYDGPYMMALALAQESPSAGVVTYPAPFARLG
jgi:putative acetyltransferase